MESALFERVFLIATPALHLVPQSIAMGNSLPASELLDSVCDKWACRESQVKQISALLLPLSPSPSSLVVHGASATGKSKVTKSYLEASGLPHAIVRCQECVTGRHLLERCVSVVHQALQPADVQNPVEHPGRCENLSALVVHLQKLLSKHSKFVLVFDGVDKQREAPPTLLPALARLGEVISCLTVVFVIQYAPPRYLHLSGTPHIHFPPYSRNQSIHIVSREPPDIFTEASPAEADYDDETHEEDKAWLWPRFCAAVWDALGQNAAKDLVAYSKICHKLWRPFVLPVVKGDFGTRDFTRLLVTQRRLLQDESILLDSIVDQTEPQPKSASSNKIHELPYYAKWLLVAAYLASFNPARFDALHFMKSTERKRRKKGGGTARSGGRPSQTKKIPRHLLAASAFTVDRLLAIVLAVLPDDLRTDIDIYKQIATLSSLRLLVRAGGLGSGDPLEPGGKWRVGPLITWEYVQSLSRHLDFDIIDYVVE